MATKLKTKKVAETVYGNLDSSEETKVTKAFIEEVIEDALNSIASEYSLADAVADLEHRKENC